LTEASVQWTVIIPVKALPHAKSRLAAASADGAAHARLVTAMRRDTAHAARNAAAVARVLVVADRPGDPTADLVQSAPGLNEGVAEAAGLAAQRWPSDGIAALVGDLPALRSQELAAALADAADHPRAFVADEAGTGTTLLTARPGVPLRPAFGPGSAARHARQAVAVSAGPGLRADVDTAEDLSRAELLGFGGATQSVTADSSARCMMTP
jgi:2-phospho-L-lactate guanylyltransferase